MIPRSGPLLFVPRGLAAVIVPPAGAVGPIEFRWPRALFATGVLVVPVTGSLADQALLSLQIEDETFQQIVSDGQGSSFDANALALSGVGAGSMLGLGGIWRWFALPRPVADGDLWHLTLFNAGVAEIAASVLLRFDEPITHEAAVQAGWR